MLKLFSKSGERFFILEIKPEKISGFLLNLDNERKLRAEKFFEDFNLGNQKSTKLLKNLWQWRQFSQTIVSLDSSLSMTSIIPLNLGREESQKPLEKVELENLLGQAVGKIFNQYREEASRQLKIDELDTILADSRINNFRIDGHNVMNPFGFPAESLQAILELTFTSRQIINNIKSSLPEKSKIFFTETGRSELLALQKIKKPPINFLALNPRAVLFISDGSGRSRFIQKRDLNWSVDGLWNIIQEDWRVSFPTVQNLYQKYIQKEFSSRASRHFQKILNPALDSLFQKIKKRKIHGPIYLNSSVNLPFNLPFRRPGITLEEIPLDLISEHLGFKLDCQVWPMPPWQIFRFLAPFWEFYYNKDESEINHWLKRRLHWLGAAI